MREAQDLVRNLNREFARASLEMRAKLAEGLIDDQEFNRQGRAAARKFNDGLTAGYKQIVGTVSGAASNRNLEAAISSTYKKVGARAAAAFTGSLRLGIAASARGGLHGEGLVRKLESEFQRSVGRAKLDLAGKLIDPNQFSTRAAQAAEEFNSKLREGIIRLRQRGIIDPSVEQAMINQMKKAGFLAGEAAAQEMGRAFRNRQAALQQFGQGALQAGQTLTYGITLPVIAMGTAMARSAGQFEKGMNLVAANTQAATVEMDKLTAAAREFGASEFGGTEVTKGMAELALAGFELNEIMANMPTIMNFATAGQIDLTRAAEIGAQSVRALNLELSEVGRVTDVLTKAAIIAQTDVQDLSVAFRYVASIGSSAGQSLEGITAALAALSQGGYTASFAGTQLRNTFARLLDPTSKASKVLADLKVKIHDNNGDLLSFGKIVQQLEERNLSATQALQLFGQRAGPGMAALLSVGSDALIEFEATLRGAEGTAKAVRDIQLKGLLGQIQFLKAALQDMAIALGESGFLGALTNIVRALTQWALTLSQSNPQALAFGAAIALVSATLGPLLVVLGKAVLALRAYNALMVLSRASTLSLGTMLATGGLVAGGLVLTTILLYKWADGARRAAEEAAAFRSTLAGLTETGLQGLQTSLRADIRDLERTLSSLQQAYEPKFGRSGLETPASRRQRERIAEVKAQLEGLRAQYTEVGKALQESQRANGAMNNSLEETRRLLAELQAEFENADFFTAGAEDGKTAVELYQDTLNSVLERLDLFKQLNLDTTQPLQDARNLWLQTDAIIQRAGGFMKANLGYLQGYVQLLEVLRETARIEFSDKATKFAELLRLRLEFHAGNYNTIIDELNSMAEEIQRRLLTVDDVDVELQLRRALAIIDDALLDFYKSLQDRESNERRRRRRRDEMSPGEIWSREMGSQFRDLANRTYALSQAHANYQAILLQAQAGIEESLIQQLEGMVRPADALVGSFNLITGGARSFFTIITGLQGAVGNLISALNPLSFFGEVLGRIASSLAPTFDAIGPTLEKFGNIIANTLGPVFEELVPIIESLFPLIQAIVSVLTPILRALMPILQAMVPILEALFPLFKALAIATTYVAEVFFRIATPILWIVGLLVKGIGYAIYAIGRAIDAIPFVSGRGIINAGRAAIDFGDSLQDAASGLWESANEMAKARDDIRDVKIGDALTDVADAAKKARENLLNVPDGYKVLLNLRRFQATEAVATPPSLSRGPGGVNSASGQGVSVTQIHLDGDIVVHGGDRPAREQADLILDALKEKAFNQFGSSRRWTSL